MNLLHWAVFLAFSAVLQQTQRRWLVSLQVRVVVLGRVHTRYVFVKSERHDLRVQRGLLEGPYAMIVRKKALELWVLYIELRIALAFS